MLQDIESKGISAHYVYKEIVKSVARISVYNVKMDITFIMVNAQNVKIHLHTVKIAMALVDVINV